MAKSKILETYPVEGNFDRQVSAAASIALDAIIDYAINRNNFGLTTAVEEINTREEEARSFRLRTSSRVQAESLPTLNFLFLIRILSPFKKIKMNPTRSSLPLPLLIFATWRCTRTSKDQKSPALEGLWLNAYLCK